MKRILILVAFVVLLVMSAPSAWSQAQMVNTHGYAVDYLTDDSTGVAPIYLMPGDQDTTESFDMRTFASLSTQFTFGAHGTGGATGLDSCAMRIYLEGTVDDTSWARVDSIQAATITAAKLLEYSNADTTYIKGWTLPKCLYKARIVFVADAAIEKDGVLIHAKAMKQR
jgi:hypothetical protein